MGLWLCIEKAGGAGEEQGNKKVMEENFAEGDEHELKVRVLTINFLTK